MHKEKMQQKSQCWLHYILLAKLDIPESTGECLPMYSERSFQQGCDSAFQPLIATLSDTAYGMLYTVSVLCPLDCKRLI